jgi:hypothetical protein
MMKQILKAGFETYLINLVQSISELSLCFTSENTEHEILVKLRYGLQRIERQILTPMLSTLEFHALKKKSEAKRIGRLISGEGGRSNSQSRIADEY